MSYTFGVFIEYDETRSDFDLRKSEIYYVSDNFIFFSACSDIFHALSGVDEIIMGQDCDSPSYKFSRRGIPINPGKLLFNLIALKVTNDQKLIRKNGYISCDFLNSLSKRHENELLIKDELIVSDLDLYSKDEIYCIDPNYESVGWLYADEFGEALEYCSFSKESIDQYRPEFSAFWDYIDAMAKRFGKKSVRVVFAGLAGS